MILMTTNPVMSDDQGMLWEVQDARLQPLMVVPIALNLFYRPNV